MREINVNIEGEIFTLWPCVKSHPWDHGPWFQDLQRYFGGATLRQAASCMSHWLVKYFGRYLCIQRSPWEETPVEENRQCIFSCCCGPSGIFCLVYRGWFQLVKKMVSVGYLLRKHWNIWRVASASLWNVWYVSLVS